MGSNLIVCGGTFDHFHKGHESLLKLAFSLGGMVIIGVTSDAFVKSKKQKVRSEKQIESFEVRRIAVLDFIKSEGVSGKAEVVGIDDLFGPTLSKDLLVDSIVVSEETRKGAEIINAKRRELGLKELGISIASQISAEDGAPISSERIRNGEINRIGRLYVKPTWFKTDLILPEELRSEFKEPLGELLTEIDSSRIDKTKLIITVGDATTKKFNQKSIMQDISVVDFKIAREEQFSSFSELSFQGNEQVLTVNNPAGHLTADLFNAIAKIFKSSFKERIVLKITGEDDLAVLPMILFSPLGTVIYYGQPGKGLVKVAVSEDSKNKAYNLVLKLKQA